MTQQHRPLRGSNAQVTAKMLAELATQRFEPDQMETATRMMRAWIMATMGGTLGYEAASGLEWADDTEDDVTWRQGMAFGPKGPFVSDMVVEIFEDPEIVKRITAMFPEVPKNSADILAQVLYRLLNSFEFHAGTEAAISPDAEVHTEDWSRIYWNNYLSFEED